MHGSETQMGEGKQILISLRPLGMEWKVPKKTCDFRISMVVVEGHHLPPFIHSSLHFIFSPNKAV